MSDKFLGSGGSNINLSNGSATIFSATLGAASLSPSRAVKTNSVKQLISSNLDISDVNNLSTELQEKDELLFVENDVHTIPDNGKIKIYAKTDNNLYKLDDLGNETGFGGAGDVVGPLVTDDSTMAFFDGTTGKLLKENVGFKFQTGLTYGDQLNVPDLETADHFSLNRELDKITNITSAVELPTPYTTMAGTLDVKTVASALHGGELDFNIGTATLDSNAIVLSSKLGNINSVGTFTMNQPSTMPPSSFQKLKFEFGMLFNLIRSEGDGIADGNLNQLFIDATRINVQSPIETTQTVFTSPQSLVTKQYVDDEAVGTTTLQQAYVASGTNPLDAKIDIDNTRVGIQLRNTTGAPANTMLEVVDIGGANRWAVDGSGSVSKNRLDTTKDLKVTHATNSVPKFSAGLFAGDEGYKIYNEATASYPLEIDALGNNVSTIGNLTINQPSSFPGTNYQKLKFEFGTLFNLIRSEGNTDGGLARLDIDAADVNIGINGLPTMAITPLETTVSNDLKTDIIIKNANDNVNIEGSQFRTGGLLNTNELQVLDAIDVGSNVISSVSSGVALTDAVNKSQLDTKIDLTQKGAANGVCPLDGSLPQAKIPNAYLPDLAITQVYVVADNVARDAIASIQMGDVAVVSTPPNNFIWNGPDQTAPLTASFWVALVIPQGTVTSVNGQSGTVSLTTDNVPETILNPYFTPPREAELINRSGTVPMTGNLNMGDNNIVDCNTVFNGGGDLTLQASSSVQVASGSKINLNCVGNVEIPSCDLDMLTNEIVGVTQITSNTVRTTSLAGNAPSINVTSSLSMNGVDLSMNGNSISDAGQVACDTLSSATATNINVAHNLDMTGKNIDNAFIVDCQGLNNSAGTSIGVNDDLSLGSNAIVAGSNRFDANALSSVSNLDIVANVGASSITLDSNTAVSIPNCNLDMVQRQIIGCSVLNNSSQPMIVQSSGGLFLRSVSGGNVNIEPVQRCNIDAPDGLWANGVLQDTAKNAFVGRHFYTGTAISVVGVPIDPILPDGVVYNFTPLNGNRTAHRVDVAGYYKITFTSTILTTVNNTQAFVQIFKNNVEISRNQTDPVKDIRREFSINMIDPTFTNVNDVYQIRLNSVNSYTVPFLQMSYERLGISN
jgi:hypothetical protein